MPNGECHVGATHTADIENLKLEQKAQNRRIDRMEAKIDWLFYLIIATLVTGIVNLVKSLL